MYNNSTSIRKFVCVFVKQKFDLNDEMVSQPHDGTMSLFSHRQNLIKRTSAYFIIMFRSLDINSAWHQAGTGKC